MGAGHCVIQGWGPQRHANGDTMSRSIAMLAILTGNVGIAGGGSGSAESVSQIGFPRMPEGTNPVKTRISFYTWVNAIDDYTQVTAKKMGLRNKEKLVEKYHITGITGWRTHTCWAGLLIAVGNIFARGRNAGFWQKRRELINLTHIPEFNSAIAEFIPQNVSGNKKLVVKLISMRQYTLLSLLYTIKNLKR